MSRKLKKKGRAAVCKYCGCFGGLDYGCDGCGKEITEGIAVTVSYGYCSPRDGEKLLFCTDMCFRRHFEERWRS